MEHIDNIYEVTQRLCGFITPYGDTNIDKTRFKNLEDTINVAERLIDDIISVGKFKDRPEHSIKLAVKASDDFIERLREQLVLCGK